MKKILYTLGLTVLLASCGSNYLDTVPQSSTGTATIFETTQNAKLAINGICRLMVNQYLSSQGFNGEGTIKTWYGNYPGNDFQKSNLTGSIRFITKEILQVIVITPGSTIIS